MAAATAGAALLAACGGDDDDGDSTGGTGSGSNGLMTDPTDAGSQAKAGGTLLDFSRDEGGSFDALVSGDSTTYQLVAQYTYPGLTKFKTGKFPSASDGEVEGDLAESWEFSPDRLSMTMKIRRGLKWENKTPVNAREIDAHDVAASWKKFSTSSALSGQLAYSERNPSASIVSIEAVDNYTVKVTMFRPDPAVLSLLGWVNTRIMPREFDGGFDPANTVIGYGPYLLESYQPSVGFKWRKNPAYHVKDRPYIDRIEVPIVPDYSTRLASFRAGNIYTYGSSVASTVTPEDILQTKKDLPVLKMLYGSGHTTHNGVNLKFGYEGAGAMFNDVRIRQALSYLIDRKAYEDVVTNAQALAAEGIDVDSRFVTWIGAYWEDYRLDPYTDKQKFGPNAKFFEYNVAEGKKLLEAAGHGNGFSTGWFFPSGRGGWQQQIADIVPGLLEPNGIKLAAEAVDNNAVFIPNMLRGYAGKRPTGKGTDGLQLIAGGTRVTADLNYANSYDTGGPSFIGMPVNGGAPEAGDPAIVDLVRKMRAEFDHDKQVALSHDFHRLMAEKAYSLPLHWSTPEIHLVWPVIGNYGYHTQSVGGASQVESRLQWWIDPTKAPLA
jgi:peptide/nickel transport system substrate-binding protein